MLIMLTGLALAVGVSAHNSLMTGHMELEDKQAYYLAEAGWQRARQAMAAGTWQAASSPGSTYTESFGAGVYAVTILDTNSPATTSGSGTYTITSAAYIPSQSNYRARRRVYEYELDVDVASTNLSLTAAASASSTNGSNVASNAKDGNNSTHWQSNVNGPGSWLQMDYGSATTLNQIVVKENANITGISAVQYSDDGSSWSSVAGLSTSNSGTTWTCDFTSASHRYMRVTFNASASKKVSVKELQSYNTATRTATVTNDGELATEW